MTDTPGTEPLENERHERVCQEYLIDLNGKQAGIRSGYSEKTAEQQVSRLFRNVKVKERIDYLLAQRQQRTVINQDYVLEVISETIERCRQATPVLDRYGMPVIVQTRKGELAGAFEYDSRSVLKGAELAGKHLKMFTERHEVSGLNGGPIQTQNVPMTKEQLEAELAARGLPTTILKK